MAQALPLGVGICQCAAKFAKRAGWDLLRGSGFLSCNQEPCAPPPRRWLVLPAQGPAPYD